MPGQVTRVEIDRSAEHEALTEGWPLHRGRGDPYSAALAIPQLRAAS
jgi:hypothetical protein